MELQLPRAVKLATPSARETERGLIAWLKYAFPGA